MYILLYEEFCVLQDNLNLELFDGDFIIIENNIFYKYPNQSNCKYIDIESEIEKGNFTFEENKIFNKFYSNSLYKNSNNFIQYRDLSNLEFENIKKIDFFSKELLKNINIDEIDKNGNPNEDDYEEIEIPLSDNQDDENS